MLSSLDLISCVKAAPMPISLKEQILDQVLGHHDDLHPAKLGKAARPKPGNAARPKHERVAEARQVGGFIFKEALPSGDEVFDYCKNGALAYEVAARDGQPVYCSCPDFRFHVLRDPDYFCKHCLLFLQQDARTEALIAEYARASAAWATAACWRHLGRITDAEANGVYARMEAARDAARKVVVP